MVMMVLSMIMFVGASMVRAGALFHSVRVELFTGIFGSYKKCANV
jgi:hypothetical protein